MRTCLICASIALSGAAQLATKEELERIDGFVAEQLALKNLRLLAAKNGIFIIDRAPLDLFAFEDDRTAWPAKAKRVLEAVMPGKATSRKLAACHVILLKGDPDILGVRAKANHRATDSEKLEKQQQVLSEVYDRDGDVTSVIDTRNKSVSEVTKEIARIVHLAPYVVTPLHDWLEEYARSS